MFVSISLHELQNRSNLPKVAPSQSSPPLLENTYLDFLLAPPPFLARCGDSSPLFELKSAIEGDSAPIVVNTTVLDALKHNIKKCIQYLT